MGTRTRFHCLIDVDRPSLHLSPLADVLGALILMTVPSFDPVGARQLQMHVAGCGVIDDGCCMPPPLRVRIAPRLVTVRFGQTTLLAFEPAFDTRGRVQLEPLAATLVRVHENVPDLHSLLLELDDDVDVGLMVAVADRCIGAGYPNLTATPDSGR